MILEQASQALSGAGTVAGEDDFPLASQKFTDVLDDFIAGTARAT